MFIGMKLKHKKLWLTIAGIVLLVAIFLIWQGGKKVPTTGNWQEPLAVLSTADFNGNLVTIHKIRDFTYNTNDQVVKANYYDQTFDLTTVSRVWYITDPFKGFGAAAHTFLSFEFSDGKYLSITIEARKVKGQNYNLFAGVLNTYPLMYIAASERDTILRRANDLNDQVYMYPVKLSQAENGGKLLDAMLLTMNDLTVHPRWYNSIWSNCTSNIANEINRISPGRLPKFSFQFVLTGYADALALKAGLLDTTLPLDQARQKFYITKISQQIRDVPNYSQLLRQKLASF